MFAAKFDAREMIDIVEQYAIEIEKNGPKFMHAEAEYLQDMIARATMKKGGPEFTAVQWTHIAAAYGSLTDTAVDALRHIVDAEEGGAREERRCLRLGYPID